MNNLYFVHLQQLYPTNSGLDVTQWLCRTCAAKRNAYIQPQFAVNGSEVCEQCGAKQFSFPVGAYIERKRQGGYTRTVAGRIVGVSGKGRLIIDWIDPNRIGGDGWRRDKIAFTAVKLANPDRKAAAERYEQRMGARYTNPEIHNFNWQDAV